MATKYCIIETQMIDGEIRSNILDHKFYLTEAIPSNILLDKLRRIFRLDEKEKLFHKRIVKDTKRQVKEDIENKVFIGSACDENGTIYIYSFNPQGCLTRITSNVLSYEIKILNI